MLFITTKVGTNRFYAKLQLLPAICEDFGESARLPTRQSMLFSDIYTSQGSAATHFEKQ